MHLKWPISWDITDITVQLDMILYGHIHDIYVHIDIYVYRYLCIYIFMYVYIHIILHGSRDLLRPYCNLGVFFVGFKHIPRHLEHKGYKNPKNTGVLLEQTKKGGIDVDTIITSWLLISRKNTSMFFWNSLPMIAGEAADWVDNPPKADSGLVCIRPVS